VIVLGVDPGTASTGFGVVEETEGQLRAVDYGVVTTAAGEPLPLRLQTIYGELRRLARLHRPASGSVEKLFFSRNVRTAMSVGQARGVALLALADAGLQIREYTPTEVKQAVSGYGAADKGQVQRMVQALLGLDELPRPDDAADALAVAICHLQAVRFEELVDS
jgi:crossover junction endodeoxyribonuclease RuvC